MPKINNASDLAYLNARKKIYIFLKIIVYEVDSTRLFKQTPIFVVLNTSSSILSHKTLKIYPAKIQSQISRARSRKKVRKISQVSPNTNTTECKFRNEIDWTFICERLFNHSFWKRIKLKWELVEYLLLRN